MRLQFSCSNCRMLIGNIPGLYMLPLIDNILGLYIYAAVDRQHPGAIYIYAAVGRQHPGAIYIYIYICCQICKGCSPNIIFTFEVVC